LSLYVFLRFLLGPFR